MALLGGGGGGAFFADPTEAGVSDVDQLAFLDIPLPYDVAGEMDLARPYDRSVGLLLSGSAESSEGSSKTVAGLGLPRLRTGRSWERLARRVEGSVGTRDMRGMGGGETSRRRVGEGASCVMERFILGRRAGAGGSESK